MCSTWNLKSLVTFSFQRYDHLLRWPRRRHYFRGLRQIETQRRDRGLKLWTPDFCRLLFFWSNWWLSVTVPDLPKAPTPLSSLSSVTKLGIRNRTIVVFKRKPCLRFCCVFFQSRWWRWTKRICQNFYFCGLEGVFVSVLDDFDTNSGDNFDRVFRCWFKFKCWLKR